MDDEGLPLARALTSLRAELGQAIEAARGEDLRFKVTEIEVQLQVVATTAVEVSAGLSLWRVVQVGGKLDDSRASTHLVKLTLTPELSGGDVHVSDDVAERPR